MRKKTTTKKHSIPVAADAANNLRSRAEADIKKQPKQPRAAGGADLSIAESQRLLHELQVHQVELEMQNAELQECRDRAETLLEKYTELYDFAPVGYLSMDQKCRILEVNLAGAALLGIERARLIKHSLLSFVARPCKPDFIKIIERVFAGKTKQTSETRFIRKDGSAFWAAVHCGLAATAGADQKVCRVALSDITEFREAREARHELELVSAHNAKLQEEIVRRKTVESALRSSELEQRRLLKKSQQLQKQLRELSHRILRTREDERKKISRELHDVITQTLIGIKLHLEALSNETKINPRELRNRIAKTQKEVERAVITVQEFAVKLRPTALDDLGLIVAMHTLMNGFMAKTGIHVHFTAFAGEEELNSDQQTALYRILQTALANVSEHSKASHVKVSLRKSSDAIKLDITDNGQSADRQSTQSTRKRKPLGLISMRERAEMLGGKFSIDSAPDGHTSVHVQIPLHQKKVSVRAKRRRAAAAFGAE